MLLTGEIPYHDDEIAAKGRVARARRRYARTQNEDNARRLLAAELVLARLRGEGGFPAPRTSNHGRAPSSRVGS